MSKLVKDFIETNKTIVVGEYIASYTKDLLLFIGVSLDWFEWIGSVWIHSSAQFG